MNLAGKFKINNTSFFLILHDVKNQQTLTLVSEEHQEDRIRKLSGESLQHPLIKTVDSLKINFNTGYVVESLKRSKVTGKVSKYGNSNILNTVVDALDMLRTYKFRDEDVLLSVSEYEGAEKHEIFNAMDEKCQFNYERRNGVFSYLMIKTPVTSFELSKIPFSTKLKGLTYRDLTREQSKKVLIASLKDIDYEALTRVLDMSWYKENGVKKKRYYSIDNQEDFELRIMTPIIKRIMECAKQHKQFYVAVDTETSGLNVYNLSSDNPAKDHCVAIPICWDVGHSYVIFTDMEHFNNVSNEYAISRLAQLFENFKGSREIEYWEEEDDDSELEAMNAFGDAGTSVKRKKLVKKTAVIERSIIELIGHNAMFDTRTFFDFGKKFYFNHDTLQMAFNINPNSVRGNNKLKMLTRYFFNAETPELSDVLGKGNEDKYRYLKNREVAEIYGCADADFTLALFFELRDLMEPALFYWYQKQDIPMIHILAQSEYWGLQTDEEALRALAKQTRESIEILKQTIYSYVGVYVDYATKMSNLDIKYRLGELTEEEYKQRASQVIPDPNAVYEFEFKPAQLRYVLYDIMKYPIKAYTDGKVRLPKIDKYVIDKLLKEKLDEGEAPFRKLSKDVLVAGVTHDEYIIAKAENPKKAKNMVLISADEFNKLKYPLALIIKKYSELNKEYTSYYKPMEENNFEGKIFKGYNLARIETRRISNPIQTTKGSLKALIQSYTENHYTLDFDMSQVEQRIMVSLSGYTEMIERMKDPEKDAHTETASMVEMKPAHLITPKERKNAKSVTFGLPYGLGERSLCEKLFGDTTPEHLMETRLIIKKWMKNNKPIVDLLEKARKDALTEWKISDKLRDFMGMWKKNDKGEYVTDENGNKIPIPVGRVQNILGFYRVFSLEGIDLSPAGVKRREEGEYTPAESSIRRKAGNYPIQATASEIFRQILIRFYNMCVKYGIEDKILWHMLIHDELLCSVSNDLHPFFIYKLVKKACMVTMKGHTQYFVGINIGDTWAQCKDDEREAPIHFVNRMIKRYDAGEFEEGIFKHPWEFIKPYRVKYIEERIGEVVQGIQPDAYEVPIDLQYLIDNFSNYTVRAYVGNYPSNGEVEYEKEVGNKDSEQLYDNLKWIKCFESWVLDVFGEGKQLIGLDGEVYSVTRSTLEKVEKVIDYAELFDAEIDDFDDDEEDDNYWEFNDESAEIIYTTPTHEELYDEYEDGTTNFEYDFSKRGQDVYDITVKKTKYENIKVINGQVIITLKSPAHMKILQSLLQSDVVNTGLRVVFKIFSTRERWLKVKDNVDLVSLDKLVSFLNSEDGYFVYHDNVIVNLNNLNAVRIVEKSLGRYPGGDYCLWIKTDKTFTRSVSFSNRVSIDKLMELINKVKYRRV